jgi:hypothetical protein
LITLDEDKRVVIGRNLKEFLPQESLQQNFIAYEGQKISLPEKLAEPDEASLEYHRYHNFRSVISASFPEMVRTGHLHISTPQTALAMEL